MEPIIVVALVTAMASIVGSAIVFFSARGKSKVDYKTALDARIDERVADQLTLAWTEIDKLKASNIQHVKLENVTNRYIRKLLAHIRAGKGNPPPPLPPELEAWQTIQE